MTDAPPIYYAIGDVHGELARLIRLHARIAAHHERHFAGRRRVLVHLGDYVDRGPDSCGVIDFILLLERQFAGDGSVEIISLMGNHELMMLEALEEVPQGAAREHWLRNGGQAALDSYTRLGRVDPDGRPDATHREWIASLPHIVTREQGRLIFVHAGINPLTYPDDEASEHMWTRSPRFRHSEAWSNPALEGVRVIHGHTPTTDALPDISDDGRRINVDTAAVYGGRLTCAIVESPDVPVRFLSE